MKMVWNREIAVLTFDLPDKLDTENFQEVEKELLEIYSQYSNQAKLVILDARNLKYLSSAGIRAVLKFRKTCSSAMLLNANPRIYEILTVTGMNNLMEILPTVRHVSLEGCAILGSGRNSTVYRLDDDKICKVFMRENSLPMVLMEKRMSRIVFQMGLTAEMSFQVVKAGKHWGMLYELINAKTLSELIRNEPDRLDVYLEKYQDFLDTIHDVHADEELPDKKSEFGTHVIPAVLPELDPEHGKNLEAVFRSVPEGNGFVHGDPHFANVFCSEDEWYIIDMDSAGRGDEIWDLVALHGTLVAFRIFDPKDVMNLGSVDGYGRIWNELLTRWEASGGQERNGAGRVIEALSLARGIAYARKHGLVREIAGLIDRLYSVLDGIDPNTPE